MKLSKKIFSVFAVIALVFTFSACFFSGEERTELQFLLSHYSGKFTDRRTAEIKDRHADSDFADKKIKKFYSSALKKDVMVYDCDSDLDFYDDGHSFESNFLYIKYKDVLCKEPEKILAEDFSSAKALYDTDWLFTDYYDSKRAAGYLKHDIKTESVYIIIQPTPEENTNLEELLKSCVIRFSNENFSGEKYIFITAQTLSPVNLDSLTVDDLYDDADLKASFVKKYKVRKNYSKLEEMK